MRFTHFVLVLGALSFSACGGTVLVDFSDLSTVRETSSVVPVQVGDRFNVGDILIESQTGVRIVVLPFRWPGPAHDAGCPPGWTTSGNVAVVQDSMSGGTGTEIQFNNASLGIIAPVNQTVSHLEFKFGEHGGNVNVIVNGTLYQAEDFRSIPTIPGVNMIVMGTTPFGTVEMSGAINPFYYSFPCPAGFPTSQFTAVVGGGQELWIDDVEFTQ